MPTDSALPRWRPATLVAFRFCVVYFALYVLVTEMIGFLIPLPIAVDPVSHVLDGVIAWTGTHVFHVKAVWVLSGSGDRLYDWVQAFCVLVIAAGVTAVWSVLDRRRDRYDGLYRWFRVFIRFAVGSTMVVYGVQKAIPLQMPAPSLARLLEPYGNFSPASVLWYSVGASFAYERLVGCAELLAAVLLFVPRTALAGALVALADSAMIFTLNMTYDVPVKLFSFHLILMSLFLIAPDARRLLAAVCAAGTRTRWAALAQIGYGACLVGLGLWSAVGAWHQFGGGVPRPALYGIWNVDTMTIDGVERPPLLTDPDRWRRVVIDRATSVAFLRLDDTVVRYAMKVDDGTGAITLSKSNDKAWTAELAATRPAPDRLILDGTIDGHAVHMDTHLFDRARFTLISRGFHWVQEFPVYQ
jgi:hypothetical protein